MKQFKTIFKFEYFNYIKNKGYIIMTAIVLVIIIALTSLPSISGLFGKISESLGGGKAEPGTEAVVGTDANAAALKAMLADPNNEYTDDVLAAYFPQYEWVRVKDINNAEALIQDGEYELAIMVDGLNYVLYEKGNSLLGQTSNGMVYEMVKNTYQQTQLGRLGVSAGDAQSVINAVPLGSVFNVGKDYGQSFWLNYVVIFLMYFVILMYGQFVTTSVVTEKSTKAMELLITSAKPFQLMFGKVIGVGAAGLTQFALILLTAFGMLRLNLSGWTEFSPMVASILELSVSGSLLLYALIFFILGFFSFAFLYAGFASTVSRMEEANSVMVMPMMLFVAAFMVAMMGSTNPEASFVVVCSFVPFLSPLVMFMRICVTDAPIYQAYIAIAINIVTVLGMAFVSSRIYRVGVMLYGKKPNLKDIVRYIVKA